jgi:hypothetical protein
MDFQFGAHFFGNFRPIGLALFRQKQYFDPESRGRENLFFNAPNAEDATPEADFASHGDVGADAPAGKK